MNNINTAKKNQDDNIEQKDCCDLFLLHLEVDEMKSLQTNMPSEDVLANLSDFFKVFGDETRLKILHLLLLKELCVCDIAKTLDMTDSAISHQLRVLKANRLAKSRREGKSIFYSLDDEHIKTLLTQGLEHISHN